MRTNWIAVVVAVALGACTGEPPTGCDTSAACGIGQECVEGFCRWPVKVSKQTVEEKTIICAKLSACVEPLTVIPAWNQDVIGAGIGHCVAALSAAEVLPPALMPTSNEVAATLRAACLVAASGCEAVRECLSLSGPALPCSSSSFAPHCQGSTAVWCSATLGADSRVRRLPCGALGLECVEGVDEDSKAKLAWCASQPCSGDTVCNGDNLSACNDGIRTDIPCATMGLTCGGAPAKCTGGGAVCSAGKQEACNGSVATTCRDGKLATFDCATMGSVCTGGGSKTAKCAVAPGDETCSEGVITFHVPSAAVSVDCKALGFVGCDLKNPLGKVTARCIAPCLPNCAGKSCGSDGCGGNCGACSPGKACISGSCADPPACQKQCAGKVCGSDGCGGSCGSCASGQSCSGGKCTTAPSGCSISCPKGSLTYSCGSSSVTKNYSYCSNGKVSSVTLSFSNGHKVTYNMSCSGSSGSCKDDTGKSCSF